MNKNSMGTGPMANLHQEFCKFHNRIALTASQKSTLRVLRDALRERIRRYFHKTLRVECPKFRSQGSFAMNTAVNPIDGEHSIEDGVYLRHLDKMDDDNWPTATAVHQWLVNAAQGHATENLMDNRACVRVRYSGQYCIDLYAYGELNGQHLLVAETGKKWTRGDPPAITRWFESYVHQRGGQLQRIVRYLKAWADHQSLQHCEMTDGLLPIVLSVYHFRAHKRDDIALAKTVEAISDTIRTEFFVLNPVDISEELTARFTTAQKETIKDAIEVFADCANGALAVQGEYKASRLWRKQLGDRFPFRYREE